MLTSLKSGPWILTFLGGLSWDLDLGLSSKQNKSNLFLVQLYFLNNPSIDFAVGGLANVTDLPGINSILRYSIFINP